MGKTITKRSDINTLADLKQYQKQLKEELVWRENALSAQLKSKLPALPWLLIKQKTRTYGFKNGKLDLAVLKSKLAQTVAIFVKRTLPKKMSFIEKWFLGFVAKKSVNKLLIDPREKPAPNTNPFVPLPIAMKTAIVNSPDGVVQPENTDAKAKEKLSLKGIWTVLKNSFTGFGDHKVTKISGSLAYYTVFSMAPLMVMVIALCSMFLKREAAEGEIYLQLKGFVGADTAAQLQGIIKNAAIGDKGIMASIIGGVTLLVGATTVFADIQDSINTIWGIKPKPKRGWLKLLQNRFLSFSVIISLGFLLLVSLGVSAILDGFSNRLQVRFKDVSVVFFYILNTLITFGVVSSIFAVIFKVLPDAKIRWRDVMAGAMVTAVLFMVGKFAISFYIGQSNVGGTYGAAGSLVILLLWAYYSSIILYFGAEFTKAYAIKYGAAIHPNAYAVTTKEIEVEQGRAPVQHTQKQHK